MEAAESLGISVARVPTYSPHSIAEHAISLMMCLNRYVSSLIRHMPEILQQPIPFCLFMKAGNLCKNTNLTHTTSALYIPAMLCAADRKDRDCICSLLCSQFYIKSHNTHGRHLCMLLLGGCTMRTCACTNGITLCLGWWALSFMVKLLVWWGPAPLAQPCVLYSRCGHTPGEGQYCNDIGLLLGC